MDMLKGSTSSVFACSPASFLMLYCVGWRSVGRCVFLKLSGKKKQIHRHGHSFLYCKWQERKGSEIEILIFEVINLFIVYTPSTANRNDRRRLKKYLGIVYNFISLEIKCRAV